jgi:hypothetical protein
VTGFAVFIGTFVALGLALGSSFSEGIEHIPLEISTVVFSAIIVASVFLVNRESKEVADRGLVWLGDAWMLLTIPFVFDFLIDSFYGKPLIMGLFAIVGILYWKGRRNNPLGFVVSFFTAAIVAGDGLGHLKGGHCVPTGITGCPVKAVSDFYLLMVLLPLTYATVATRDRRPSLPILLLTVFLAVSVFVGFGFSG